MTTGRERSNANLLAGRPHPDPEIEEWRKRGLRRGERERADRVQRSGARARREAPRRERAARGADRQEQRLERARQKAPARKTATSGRPFFAGCPCT